MTPPPAIRVQTVLYQSTPADFERFLRGVTNATALARRIGAVSHVVVAVGDSSPSPVLTMDQVERCAVAAEPHGVADVSYDFFGENLGSAGGHNRLLTGFDQDFVLFLNPDAVASPHVLGELLLPHADARVGITEARQLPLEHPKSFDRRSGDTSWASTAGALVSADVVEKVGGFDADSFFLYCDDVDFSWRARLAGFRVVHQPTARIFHDKRLDPAGQIVVGDAEHYYAAEAALMLAWKYSRDDLIDQWLPELLDSPMELRVKAAQAFVRRRAEGRLPERLDPEGRVAEFVGSNFAEHRFSYSD